MINKLSIVQLIEQGESDTLEFKSSFSKEVIETIVAMSNTKGGCIIIGCNNAKNIIGITITDESIQKWQNEVKQNTEPAIFPTFETLELQNKTLVVVTVDEFPLKPITFKNRYYSRKNNSNHLMTANEIVELRFISLNYSFDAFPVKTTYNQLDDLALQFFKKQITNTGRYVSNGDLMLDFEKLGLIIDGNLTRAAQLLFGTHHTAIHIGRFKTADTIIDDLVIRSPLILAVEEAMNFIKRNITLSYSFTGELKRVERWQFPLQAIRELLLNAVVHKDYTNPTDVIVKIFDDSIEISNPGKLMSGLKAEDLLTDTYQARHRNKLLAETFYLIGDIEKYGTGFIRIRKWLTDYPELEYKFADLNEFIRSTFTIKANDLENVIEKKGNTTKREQLVNDAYILISDNIPDIESEKGTEKGTEKDTEKGTEKFSLNQKLILSAIGENPYITSQELAVKIGIRADKIRVNISKLKIKGVLKRIGPDKGGFWQVINSNPQNT